MRIKPNIIKHARVLCAFVIIALITLSVIPHSHDGCEGCLLCDMRESLLGSILFLLIFSRRLSGCDDRSTVAYKTYELGVSPPLSPIERADKLSN